MNYSKISALSALLVVSIALINYSINKGQEWAGLWLNLATELLGAVVTFLIFDYYIGNREKIQDAKNSLIRDLHSEDRELRLYSFSRLIEENLLNHLKINGVNLDGLTVTTQKFSNIDFSFSSLNGCNFSGCEFYNCRFDKSDLKGSVISDSTFKKCSFKKTDFSGTFFTKNKVIHAINFEATLHMVNLEGSEFEGTDFSDCKVLDTDINQAKIK